MPTTPIQSGESVFRPRARLIKTIGEELISSDIVAVLELVKNSYDADSSIIVIEFTGHVITEKVGNREIRKLVKDKGAIDIYDDGVGMTLETVREAWMEPATISKKSRKSSTTRSRRYTGEKGIGRFSSAKLSSELTIVTRHKNDNEVVASFNWRDFENDQSFLDEVLVNWEVREPLEFKGSKHGTSLKLEKLNSDWDEEKFRQLRITLQRLINPIAPIPDFLIELRLPKEFISYAGVVQPSESLEKSHYEIKGSVDENGVLNYDYSSKKSGSKSVNDIKLVKSREDFRTGPFTFDFRVWDRDAESLSQLAKDTQSKVSDIKAALNEVSGISIYRDGFRVLPYGDPKFDWLRLDLRRVNNPTLRISNNQIIGFIVIELENNPKFTDQSNREGIVDSDEFNQLKEFIVRILSELEVRRYEERPRDNVENTKERGLFDLISISPIIELIRERLPNDKAALEIVNKTEESLKKGITRIQEVLSRYRRLSTLGLLVDVVLHDGNNFLGQVDSELQLLSKSIKKNGFDNVEFKTRTSNINEARKILSQLFKRLEPFGGRKRGNPKKILLETVISETFSLFDSQIQKLNVETTLPSTETELLFVEGDFELIIVNLLQNALYWLQERDSDRRISVSVENFANSVSIVFSDNGPGIDENHYELIFDPYFSTKPDGIGLGLTIVGELVTENNGNLMLMNNGPLDGATFELTFQN